MLKIGNDKNKIAYIINIKSSKIVNSISYDVKESDNTEGLKSIELNDNHKFQLAPIPKSERERTTLFVSGEAGAGKSYFTKTYAINYNKLYPKNDIFLISYLEHDETLEAFKKIQRIKAFEKEFLAECIDMDLADVANSLFIFDDIDSIQDKKTKNIIYGFLNKLLRIGRHKNISVVYVGHELYASHELKSILNESQYITFFPKRLNFKKTRYLLEEYFGFSKEQVEKIKNIKNSRSITIMKEDDKIVITEKEIFMI